MSTHAQGLDALTGPRPCPARTNVGWSWSDATTPIGKSIGELAFLAVGTTLTLLVLGIVIGRSTKRCLL